MKNILCLCLAIFVYLQFNAQDVFKFDYTIASQAFGDEREISVYLPPSYYKYPDDKYTITYILDGQFSPFIDLAVKVIEYNTYMYKYTPTIVVGIHAKKRGWEFSMPDSEDEDDQDYQGGRAPQLRQHFRNEVFPLIDSIYKRTKDFKSIIGHSAGGIFVLKTLFSDEKDLFDSYIGISPALRPGENTILEDAVKRLNSGESFEKFLYCSSGTVGNREELFGGAVTRLDSILNVYPEHGLIWRKFKFEGMGHWTCVPPSVNSAMVELTRAFRVDEKTAFEFAKNEKSMKHQMDAFYLNLKKVYGFEEIPAAGYLHQIAVELMYDKNDNESALELYNWGIKKHPKHYTIRKGKGKLLLRMGKKKEANVVFIEAKVNLEGVREKIGEEAYQDQLEYINKKIKESAN